MYRISDVPPGSVVKTKDNQFGWVKVIKLDDADTNRELIYIYTIHFQRGGWAMLAPNTKVNLIAEPEDQAKFYIDTIITIERGLNGS